MSRARAGRYAAGLAVYHGALRLAPGRALGVGGVSEPLAGGIGAGAAVERFRGRSRVPAGAVWFLAPAGPGAAQYSACASQVGTH